MVILYLDAFIIATCKCLCLAIIWMIQSIHRMFIHPYAYSILILLSTTIIAAAIFITLLLLLYYCYYYKTVATNKPLWASPLSGAAELTTHLSRLINILWLPLCRINKFGLYFLTWAWPFDYHTLVPLVRPIKVITNWRNSKPLWSPLIIGGIKKYRRIGLRNVARKESLV